MKKALFSLLLAIACMPMAFGQNKAGRLLTTDTTVCSNFLWPVTNVEYTHDTVVLYQQGDTTFVLNLTVHENNYDTIDAREITGGCQVSWNGKLWKTAGEYIDTIKVTGQCDSIVKIQITLNGADTLWNDAVITCDRYIFYGDTLTTSGVHYHLDTATATTDCRLNAMNLTIVNSFKDTANVVVRDTVGGCDILWLNQHYSFADTNEVIYGMGKTTRANCDSLMAIRITAFTGIQHDSLFVKNCGKYRWTATNLTYETDGIYTHLDTSNNCTRYEYLVLTLVNNYDTATRRACETYTYTFNSRQGVAGATDRATFTESGIYDTDMNGDTLYSTHFNTRCRTYHTLNLTIDTVEMRYRNFQVDTTVCDRFDFTFSGQNRSFDTSVDTTLVRNVRYGDYCYDSIGQFKVTIKHKSYMDYNETRCDSYFWPFTGETYTSSTTRTVVLDSIKNAVGCDSIGRLILTINYTPEVSITGNWHLDRDVTNVAVLKVVDDPADHNTYKWFKNNESTPFSTSDSVNVTVNANTDIHLEAKSNKGCSANKWITITYTVGIDDVENINVNLYPNPASRFLSVESTDGLSQVVIYNALGQQVIARRDINANATQLDLGALATGVYTMQIRSLNGEQATRKFIVNK